MVTGKTQKNAKYNGMTRRERMRKQKNTRVIFGVVVILLAALYFAGVFYFRNHFLPGTVVNGVSCGFKNVAGGKKAFDKKAEDYRLSLLERDGSTEEISGADIGLAVTLGDTLDEVIESQNSFLWVISLVHHEEFSVDAAVSYEADKLSQVLDGLSCMDESNMYDSENASLSDYTEGTGYTMADAVHGTRIADETFLSVLDEAITNFDESIDLAAENCYIEPAYTEDSDEAQEMLATANRYVNTTVTFTFGDQSEVIDGELISTWIQVGEDCSVSLDEEAEAAYIKKLASTYDTKWKSRTLVAHSGSTVTVPEGGNYGWRVNQEETLEELNGYLESGEDYTGELVWYQTAAQYGDEDYGSTYIEVSISAQHMWYYQNGTVVLQCDFVSGDVSEGHDTPKGCYRIAYKARNQTLEGQGYSSPVSYWMPFVDGCGFHDADWRDEFGGTIYLEDGSHGCINMPVWAAKELYDLVEAGTAVLIY